MRKRNVDLVCDIAELISLVAPNENNNDILQRIVTSVAKHMLADVCSIYVYDEQSSELTLRATKGLNPKAIGKVVLPIGEGITGRALREMRPIRVGKASQSASYKFFPGIEEEKFEAFLAVPILSGMRRIGVLVLQAKEINSFSKNDTKAVRAIAAQLATMIENFKLLSEARNQNAKKEEEKAFCKQTPPRKKMVKGRSASAGITQGKALFLNTEIDYHFLRTNKETPPHTYEAFKTALDKTKQQIHQLQKQTSAQLADVAVLIFSAHLLILEDKQFSGEIETLIQSGTSPIEAITIIINKFTEQFSKSGIPLIREKVLDVKDLGNRLIRNLINEDASETNYKNHIIIADELLPSDILKLSTEHTEGFIISSGVTSHNAIICRSLGIPMIAISREKIKAIQEGDALIMDAEQGTIHINPDKEIRDKYDTLKIAWQELQNRSDLKNETRTKDGQLVHIYANINLLSDLTLANKLKANGVGLYRSEFPFIIRNSFPSEEEQFIIYSKLIEQMHGKEVTYRTLDIGGDKMLSYYSNVNEANPFLGMRAIRFSLHNKDIFSQQLRAFLRAGVNGKSRIMFPLISSVDDFIAAREIVHECIDALENEGVPHSKTVKLGVMIELPSAVEVVEELAEEADFLSIGSNDLIQYMLAVDRTNEMVSALYNAHHPAILRAINRTVQAAIKHDKDVSICGDLCTDKKLLPFLIGIGIKKFSIDMHKASILQRVIQGISTDKATETAQKILRMGKISDVEDYLSNV